MTPTPTPLSPFYQFLNTTDPLIHILLDIVRALVVLVIAMVLAGYAKRWVVGIFTRSKVSINTATLIGNLAQAAVVVLGIIFVLPLFGVDWTGLLTLLGAAGLALSLSMQDLLKNVIAGIYILIEQPFHIGDRISVKEATGVVQGIELRTTILSTEDNLQLAVPNSTILNEILTNRSASNLQKQVILVQIKGNNLTEISQQIDKTLKDFPEIAAAPGPSTALEEVKDGIARLKIEFWVPAGMKLSITPQIAEALQMQFPDAALTVI